MKRAGASLSAGVLFLFMTGLLGCATPGGEEAAPVTEKNPTPKTNDKAFINLSPPAPSGVEAEQVLPSAVFRESSPVLANTSTLASAPGTVPPAADAQASASETNSPYKIGPQDVLAFRSYDDEKLSGSATVRYDGMISLPMVADVKVGGLSREEATKAIIEAYSVIYNEPQITLTVTETRSKIFTVMGDVARPSEFPYTRPLTLLDAIIMAGGLRSSMSSSETFVGSQGQLVKALLIRHTNGTRDVTDYDLRNLKMPGPHASDTVLLPGDIVYVPESINLIYLLGAVGRPSVYRSTEGMTLLMLLANAGGLQESAARMRQVVLIREINTEQTKIMLVNVKEILKTGKDILLSAGDIIYVPRKRLVRLGEFVSQVTGTVSPVLNLQQQVMSLYTQAYGAYYTKQQYNNLYNNPASTTNGSLAALQQQVTNLTNLVGH
ncbi:MAG: polysaccharide export protein [Candidatus Hydrogenedentes bacterium]|nr:polysaccharide export protein [Candidatus Hydrogenedentota bacterium]